MQALYFVRHGESEFNARELVAGKTDQPLSELGHEQAVRAGEWAKEHGLHFDVIVSSDLSRAQATARHIADIFGYPHQRIVLLKELRERDCGDFEGGPVDAYYETPEATAVHEHGVEPLSDLYARASRVIQRLGRDYPDKSVLIVAHSGIGKMLRLVLDGRDASELDKTVTIPNATIFRID